MCAHPSFLMWRWYVVIERLCFQRDLSNYLESYELGSHLRQFVDAIRGCDMSAIDVFFLCSVPGSHEHARYGQAAVEDLLKSHADPVIREWPVTVQCSSIGSLGKAIIAAEICQ